MNLGPSGLKGIGFVLAIATLIVACTTTEKASVGDRKVERSERWPEIYRLLLKEWRDAGRHIVEYVANDVPAKSCWVRNVGKIDGDPQFAEYIDSRYWAMGAGGKDNKSPRQPNETICEHRWDSEKASFIEDSAVPWSAAFISFIFREAGVPKEDFERNEGHHMYLRYIDKKAKSVTNYDFVIHNAANYAPQPGDLICASRGCNSDFAFGKYNPRSHCDIVVEVDNGAGLIRAIGGNVQDGVAMTITPIDSNGLLVRIKDVRDWKVVVQNKLANSHNFPPIQDEVLKRPPSRIECSVDRRLDQGICAKGATEKMKLRFEQSTPLKPCGS